MAQQTSLDIQGRISRLEAQLSDVETRLKSTDEQDPVHQGALEEFKDRVMALRAQLDEDQVGYEADIPDTSAFSRVTDLESGLTTWLLDIDRRFARETKTNDGASL